jgi:two-component system, OmpR family, sensor histidine kinase BaeS
MKLSLRSKLILSFVAVALLTILVVSVVVRLNSGNSLYELVIQQQTATLSESITTYYNANQTMAGYGDFLQTAYPDIFKGGKTGNQSGQGAGQGFGPGSGQGRQIRGVIGIVDSAYQALIPTSGYAVGQVIPQDKLQNAVPVAVNGQTVAWIIPDTNRQFELNAEEQSFLQRTNQAIGYAALAGILVAVVLGALLASRLLKPIRLLTKASKELANGKLDQQVPVTSTDELGQLSTTFNQMSKELSQADEQRKRLTADITHDLSTPIQIISGYMEMAENGNVEFTPQRVEILKTELEHLSRLVGDLGTLTQVEAGGLDFQMQRINPMALLKNVYQTYLPIAARQNVELILEESRKSSDIFVDEGRTAQVLKNLIENALRYTGINGKIILSVTANDYVHLRVKDNGSGIDSADLPFVFDRFYRADKSRGGNSGKMGLGLAICKALVNAQGGVITASSDGKGFGTTIDISFPVVK